MRLTPFCLVLCCLVFAACCPVREGVVIAKRARTGMASAYGTYLSFRYDEPTIYWVKVKGRDDKGRIRCENILLFRHDWDALRVGDHWSRKGGFSPAEAFK